MISLFKDLIKILFFTCRVQLVNKVWQDIISLSRVCRHLFEVLKSFILAQTVSHIYYRIGNTFNGRPAEKTFHMNNLFTLYLSNQVVSLWRSKLIWHLTWWYRLAEILKWVPDIRTGRSDSLPDQNRSCQSEEKL